MSEENIVTMRDVYTLVQQLNTRTAELVQQVNQIAERAEEDRRQFGELTEELGRLKIKVYASIAAIAIVGTILAALSQVGNLSGH
ncbi:hypothetical protein ABT282_07570 [Streptomyces sp. NPDC000927]|uniref:hypothetical protein n=1 Tax=Streptomyces sp. NPDC000927 TaxID=3154371 RepID=UPI00331DF2F0